MVHEYCTKAKNGSRVKKSLGITARYSVCIVGSKQVFVDSLTYNYLKSSK